MFKSYDINSIGKKLCILRKSKNYTMKHLAILTNSSQGYISDIEHGRTIPSIPKLIELCSALDISLKEFFNEELEEAHFNSQLSELIKNAKNLSIKQIDLLNELLKTMK